MATITIALQEASLVRGRKSTYFTCRLTASQAVALVEVAYGIPTNNIAFWNGRAKLLSTVGYLLLGRERSDPGLWKRYQRCWLLEGQKR